MGGEPELEPELEPEPEFETETSHKKDSGGGGGAIVGVKAWAGEHIHEECPLTSKDLDLKL